MELTFEHFLPLLIYVTIITLVSVISFFVYCLIRPKLNKDYYSQINWWVLILALLMPLFALIIFPFMLHLELARIKEVYALEEEIKNVKKEAEEYITKLTARILKLKKKKPTKGKLADILKIVQHLKNVRLGHIKEDPDSELSEKMRAEIVLLDTIEKIIIDNEQLNEYLEDLAKGRAIWN